MENGKVTLKFRHPTDSTEELTASVSPEATPKFLIDQLVQAGFIPPLGATGRYVLRNGATGVQLLENGTLASAGLGAGGELLVEATMSGAESGGRP